MDDGSTDESWRVITSFGAAIRAGRQINQGPIITRNRLLELSRGEWIQFLDADDEVAADKLELQMARRHSAEILYGSMRLEWFEGQNPVRRREHRAEAQPDAWAGWFRWKYPNPSACLFRQDWLRRVNGWDPDYYVCEDYALLRRLFFAGARAAATPEAWSVYRQWSVNQLVNKHAVALAETRLHLMLETAKRLAVQDRFNEERRQAFQNAAFLIVRNLYKISPGTGVEAWTRLRNEAPRFDPSPACAPAAYRFLYRWFGFTAAEKVAGWRRQICSTAVSKA